MVKVYRKDLDTFYEVSEERAIELEQAGYSRDPSVAGTEFSGGGSSPAEDPNDGRTTAEGLELAQALYSFMPQGVLDAYADAWVSSGNQTIALAQTRESKAWKDEFGFLMRDDGTMVMDEMSALSTKASYKETLAEVGIFDYTDFEEDFNMMLSGHETGDPVSAQEFQDRIDIVYGGVKEQIPEVEKLFRERYDLPINTGTVFAALINPKIQDKVLAGDIATLQLQAEATSRGFSTTFARFQELKNMGLTQESAKGLYEGAGDFIGAAKQVGRDLDISTLESAAVGDTGAQKTLRRIQAELEYSQGATFGATKKDDKVTGLLET